MPPSKDRSTTAIVTLGKARAAIELVLVPEMVDALVGTRPTVQSNEKMTSRRRAITDERVRVSAMLGTATVSWRDLTTLAAGQVIVLDQTLDAPCTLTVGSSGKVGEAQLGTVGDSMAVQVTRVSTSRTTG
jgi:flagellar motor switch protein FliM